MNDKNVDRASELDINVAPVLDDEPLDLPVKTDGPIAYVRYALLITAIVAGAAWIAAPEPPPEGYASDDGLIIR